MIRNTAGCCQRNWAAKTSCGMQGKGTRFDYKPVHDKRMDNPALLVTAQFPPIAQFLLGRPSFAPFVARRA